jgi:hypothetical protein
MKIKIEFNCDNAAFGDYPEYEVHDILKDLAEDLQAGGGDAWQEAHEKGGLKLRDHNGNTIGFAKITR